MIDLDAYFRRIGYAGRAGADLRTLRELHLRHPAAIAFENLSCLLGEPVPLALDRLEDKLVNRRRGGYCFEHNRLFAAALERLGFAVTGLAARVLWNRGEAPLPPRTHMVLEVRLGDDERYLADVGFGGLTLTGPLRLETGIEQPTPHETFRLRETGGEYTVEARLGAEWRALYRFDLQPQQPIDFEVLNHYVSTHPGSHFLSTLMAARPTPEGRYALLDNRLAVHDRHGVAERRTLASVAELRGALSERFGIDVPAAADADSRLGRLIR